MFNWISATFKFRETPLHYENYLVTTESEKQKQITLVTICYAQCFLKQREEDELSYIQTYCDIYIYIRLKRSLTNVNLNTLYKFCRYGQYSLTFPALALRFSLTKAGQCSKRQTILSVSAVHQPFYISFSICISTLPTQHTTFISLSIICMRMTNAMLI